MQNTWDAMWIDGHLVTLTTDDDYGIIKDAAIACQNGKIVWLGAKANLPAAPEKLARQVYSIPGQWLTPGLIDCHTHIVYGGNRVHEFEQRLQGASYAEIAVQGGGICSTVMATRMATENALVTQSLVRVKKLIAHGVTSLEIKSGYGLELETELKMLRVARELAKLTGLTIKTTFLGAHAVPPEYCGKADEYIDLICQHMLPAVKAENLADAVDAFCENIAFSPTQVNKVFMAAKQLNLPVKLHAEQLSDQAGTQLAARYGALSADHLEYVSEQGVAALAAAGSVAVLLPGAFYFLQETQRPPINLFKKYKVPIAIATDCNPGSSPTTNLLLMMNMACVLFAMTPLTTLKAVTLHAAKALGMAESHGSLAIAKAADFAIWDISHPAELAYAIGDNPCQAVVKAGQVMAI